MRGGPRNWRWRLRLERLRSDGRKEDLIEMEGGAGRARDGEMAHVRRIKAAAKEGDARSLLRG